MGDYFFSESRYYKKRDQVTIAAATLVKSPKQTIRNEKRFCSMDIIQHNLQMYLGQTQHPGMIFGAAALLLATSAVLIWRRQSAAKETTLSKYPRDTVVVYGFHCPSVKNVPDNVRILALSLLFPLTDCILIDQIDSSYRSLLSSASLWLTSLSRRPLTSMPWARLLSPLKARFLILSTTACLCPIPPMPSSI